MDFTSLWFIAVMTLVGGVVAVLADALGRKLGKRKLRLGRLRPKHTAILLTGITGALVTIITIALVALFSAEVRQWLIEGREAVKSAVKSKQEVARIQSQLNDLSVTKNEAERQRNKTLGDLKLTQSGLQTSTSELEERKREMTRLQTEFNVDKSRFSRQSNEYQGKLSKLEKLMKQRETALGKLEESLKKADKVYKGLDEIYKKLQKNYGQLEANFGVISNDRDAAFQKYSELDGQNQKLEEDNEKLAKERDRLNSDSEKLKGEIERQRGEVELYNSAFQAEGANTRFRPIAFELGQEFVRKEVVDFLTIDDVRSAIRNAIATAKSEVERRAGMDSFLYFPKGSSEQQYREGLARRLLESRGPSVIVVSSLVNVFANDQKVALDINAYPNPIVFQRGQVLGETRVDGSQPEGKIVQQITELLQTTVRQKAMEAKMIPSGERNSTFGNIDPSETIRIVSQIKAFGRSVRLQALAKEQTRAAGPLNIEFRVR